VYSFGGESDCGAYETVGNCSPLCVGLTRVFGIERVTGG
jgi:hypothetical protein